MCRKADDLIIHRDSQGITGLIPQSWIIHTGIDSIVDGLHPAIPGKGAFLGHPVRPRAVSRKGKRPLRPARVGCLPELEDFAGKVVRIIGGQFRATAARFAKATTISRVVASPGNRAQIMDGDHNWLVRWQGMKQCRNIGKMLRLVNIHNMGLLDFLDIGPEEIRPRISQPSPTT